MKRLLPVLCSLLALLALSLQTPVAHASVHNCTVIKPLQKNLTKLKALTAAVPHLSLQQIKARTNVLRFSEVNLEMGAPKRVVPKAIDKAYTKAIDAIRKAGERRAAHDGAGYRSSLAQAQQAQASAWKLFKHWRGSLHC